MSVSAPVLPDFLSTPPEAPWREFVRAPLVPIALAVTAGLIADRYLTVPLGASLLTAVAALIVWFYTRNVSGRVSLAWVLLCTAALGAAYHHSRARLLDRDDISTFAKDSPRAVRIRGILAEEPDRFRAPRYDPLMTVQRTEQSIAVLDVTEVEGPEGWRPGSGRVRMFVEGRLSDLHCGDLIAVTGRLSRLESPGNPGERDHAARLRDRGISAELRIKHSVDPVVRLKEGWRASLFGWLAVIRGWGSRVLERTLPDESGIAAALLLGDRSALDREEWDAFVRSGVVHVLAISGLHLMVLAGFLWLVLRACGVRSRDGAWAVALFILVYALMTGARPSAIRAAVMVCVACGGIILRRPVIPANTFAFAWLVVIMLNPTDPFTIGCQLSFLSVFVLIWGAARWLAPRELTPAEELIEESRGLPAKIIRAALRWIWNLFAITAILTIANVPLILSWQNVASPFALLIGPPMVVLVSIALVAGFLLLIAAPLGSVAAWPFARVTEWTLATCEWLVHMGDRVPLGHFYSPAPSSWWVLGFYVLAIGIVLLNGKRARQLFAAIIVWVIFGLVIGLQPRSSDEARITFLAVGHGGCVVIETPDGRVLLYDAGTTIGPNAVRTVIAPYLWSRGISRIDEVFISHADLDHFNGLPELLRRFPVGQVAMTPTFADKEAPGVEHVLSLLDRHSIPRRIVKAGDHFTAGTMSFAVLHPPESGPAGNENSRSMVLLVRHGGHSILLTGDLEGEGQTMAIMRPLAPVDVMLAPHHGAKNANAPGGNTEKPEPGVMATWARPKLVISSQRAGMPTEHLHASYGAAGAQVWDTPTAGAVTIRSHSTGLLAEAFRTGEKRVISRGKN